MAISYTWDVSNCEVFASLSGKSDVIHTVSWKLIGTDGTNKDSDGNGQTATVYGRQKLDTSDLSSFKAWSSLSASDVQGFVENAMGSDEVAGRKTYVDQLIGEKITPVSVNKILGE